MTLCVVVPVYNEQEVLPLFVQRLTATLDGIAGGPHQMLFVNDGSADQSLAILREAAARDPRVSVLSLSRNFGHQAAIAAALDHAKGDATIILDADLQDPPEAITEFVRKFEEGYHVVYAQRVKRKEGIWLRVSYFLFYRMLAMLADIDLPLDAGDFGLMSARVVEEIRSLPEHLRYTRGLRRWVGFKQIGIPIERAERKAGESKYSPFGLLRLAADGIFAFSTAPLHAAAVIGSFAVVLSAVFAIYSVVAKFVLHQSPKGFTALTLLITFVSGVNLLFLGIIGAYIARIYEEVKRRPVYIVEHKIGAMVER
ncbi:MAG: glycosyltransferase family 2 protein [Terriglobales bacterium]|jgi:glycosyltransferase involved in cell wall biosynthesis